jgi:ABC-type lipoprotein release transport system permease subunit
MMQDVRYALRQWRRAPGFALTVVAVLAPSPRGTLAWFATSFATSYIYGVRAHDTLTFSAVSIVLALSSLLAAWLPARRAAAVDPILALRSE